MKAKVTENGDLTIVHLIGQINYESVDPFRETCQKNFIGKKVIFNMQDLSFVGSTGITPFINTIVDIARTNPSQVKLCRVSSEFRKMIAAQDVQGLEIFEDQVHAEYAYMQGMGYTHAAPQMPTVVDEIAVAPAQPAQVEEAPKPIFENRPWEDPSNY